MIDIVLLVLKIMGIILLSIIMLLVFLLFLILVVPVTYRFDIYTDSGINVKGRFKALFGLFSIDISTNEENQVVYKLFGIPFEFLNNEEEAEYNDSLKEETEQFNMSVQMQQIEADTSQRQEEFVKKSLFAKLEERLLDIIKNIRVVILNIINSLKNIRDSINKAIEIIQDENFSQTFLKNKVKIFKLFKHLSPSKSSLNLTFGLDDPADVGYILAIISPFYSYYGKWLSITPNFEMVCFNLEGYIKGHCFISHLLFIITSVYFQKNFRKIRKRFKSIKNGG